LNTVRTTFYEGKFDAAIRYHEQAIKEAGARIRTPSTT
jgi:hypothetical protein